MNIKLLSHFFLDRIASWNIIFQYSGNSRHVESEISDIIMRRIEIDRMLKYVSLTF